MNDLDDFFEYASKEGVGEMAGFAHHQDKKTSQKILTDFIRTKKTFALEYAGKIIGSLGIETYDETLFPEFKDRRCRELGFVLSKDYWGRGLMSEAVREVLRYLFCEVRLDLIFCAHYEFNDRSAHLSEKCGFKFLRSYQKKTRMNTLEKTQMMILSFEDYLRGLFAKWIKILNIKGNWDIDLHLSKDPAFKKSGDIKIDPEDKKAIVYLNILDPKDENLEETIVHELLHLKLYPLDQFSENMILANYKEGSKAQNMLYYEFLQSLEVTVEELAKCLIKELGDSTSLSYGRLKAKKSFEELYEGLRALK